MKALYIKIPVWLVAVIALSCSGGLSYKEAMDKNRSKLNQQDLADANFLVEMKSANLLQLQLTQLAIDTGYASSVVDMARQSVEDHLEVSEELRQVASKRKIKLPSQMSEMHQGMYNQVAASDRDEFDENFIRTLKRINDDVHNEFMDMATEANNPDVRTFAARNLDVTRVHSERIKQVESKMLSTY